MDLYPLSAAGCGGGKLTADLGIAKASLINLKIQNYNPAECPLCKAGIPAIKPGSRVKK